MFVINRIRKNRRKIKITIIPIIIKLIQNNKKKGRKKEVFLKYINYIHTPKKNEKVRK